jgi:hypothetical protein
MNRDGKLKIFALNSIAISGELNRVGLFEKTDSAFGYFPLGLAVVLIIVGLIVRYRHRDIHKDDSNAPH